MGQSNLGPKKYELIAIAQKQHETQQFQNHIYEILFLEPDKTWYRYCFVVFF